MNMRTERRSGFTLVEIMIVVAIIGMLAAMCIPSYVRARANSQATVCVHTMLDLEGAAQQWALEQGKKNGETPTFPDDLMPYIKLNKDGKIPPCPAGGLYDVAALGTIPSVTCTVGNTTTPAHQMP